MEWSRIEPAEGEFDAGEIAHYRNVLGALTELGLTPMVTLHHFTSPAWFARRGGWEADGAETAWLPFVRRVAAELGDLVAFWCTLNEPNVYGYLGWIEGEFPPGRRGDLKGMLRVLANLRRAHVAAYSELHRLTPAVPVGVAHHKRVMLPAGAHSLLDRGAATVAQNAADRWPAGTRWEMVADAPADFLGLNHYTGDVVRFDARRTSDFFIKRFNPDWLPETEFGWALNPEWLQSSLLELRGRGLPIYVTENGIATSDDRARERFLLDSLGQVWQAAQRGADVRGYFHWTSMDNFEWARGYSMRFGLIGVDRATQERSVRPSGRLFARMATANALAADL